MPATEHEHDWTIALRRQPAGPGNSNHNTDTFEIICQLCGDDPALGHQEVSAKLQQIRGPYTLRAAIPAYIRHEKFHNGTGDM